MERKYPHPCAPITLGRTTFRNRMFSAPMGGADITNDGCIGPKSTAFYELRAKGGAAAVTVHGRTAAQRYGGSSDVDAVKTLAKTSRVPIIYNGDVTRDNITELENTFGAVAIGRGALACPGIFSDVRVDPLNIAREHLRLLSKYFDERYTVNASRKFFVHYFKGVVGGRTVREGVNRAQTVKEVHDVLDKFARM